MVIFGNLKKNKVKGGFIDSAYKFFNDRLPYRVRRYLEDNGNKRIESITIYRQPIMSMISKLFSILSRGKFDDAKGKLDYDDLYHLYIIVKLSDDTTCVIEKNQNINIGDPPSSAFNGEKMEVDMRGLQPTLLELMENTRKGMGDNAFYSYSAFKNNCQNFIFSILKYNRLITDEYQKFVMQNANELLKSLPAYTSTLANLTTTGAGYFNRFLQAVGLKGFADGGLVI